MMPTTRYGRYAWRRGRYLFNRRRWYQWRWEYGHSLAGKTKKLGLKPVQPERVLMKPAGVSSASYDAFQEGSPSPLVTFTVSDAHRSKPPHVKITNVWYLAMLATNTHAEGAILGYHLRRVLAQRKRVRSKRTKRERQITGANWQYFRTGYFPDWDILGRHPNETDDLNGLPGGTTLWPDPLGY